MRTMTEMGRTLPQDVVDRAETLFGEQGKKVCEQLGRLSADLELNSARVLRCILHLSQGDPVKLKHYTDVAQTDWRDVIYWAEYDEQDQRIRDFDQPFGE